MPMPRAASIRCAGTMRRPAMVLRTIGSSVSDHSPKIAGGAPMPSTDMASARIASVGIVVPRLTTWVDRVRRSGRIAGRVSTMPSGTPISDRERAGDRRRAPGAGATDRRCRGQCLRIAGNDAARLQIGAEREDADEERRAAQRASAGRRGHARQSRVGRAEQLGDAALGDVALVEAVVVDAGEPGDAVA